MDKEILNALRALSEEEIELRAGREIDKTRYADGVNFEVDSAKLLEKGRLIEIRPHTRFAHFPVHTHNYVELVYMCLGTTTHILNGMDKIVLRAGDLLFMNQNATQEILPAGENDIAVNFILLPAFFDTSLAMLEENTILHDFLISALSPNSSYATYLHFKAADILPVQNLIENMIWSLLNKQSATAINTTNQITMGLLLQNLSMYAKAVNKSSENQYEQSLLFEVLRYIDTNYKDGTLEEIAGELNEPAYYVSRLLKKHTGSNFKELLVERKLRQAAYLLSHTTMSVESIYTHIGYDNSSYFYRKFREMYGVSPREFRKKK